MRWLRGGAEECCERIIPMPVEVPTRAVVTFGGHDARRYAWALLGCAAAASIAENMAHALLSPGPVHPAIAAVVAVVPPVAALAMTHLAVVRARVRQDMEAAVDEPALLQVEAAPSADAPLIAKDATIAECASEPQRSAPLVSVDARDNAVVDSPDKQPCIDARQLVLDLFDAGGLSGRAIAAKVGVSESTVRRWKDARGDAAA